MKWKWALTIRSLCGLFLIFPSLLAQENATPSTTVETTSSSVNASSRKKLVLGLLNGGSTFFEPIIDGWHARCDELNQVGTVEVVCHSRLPVGDCVESRSSVFAEFYYNLSVDAIAVAPCGNLTHMQLVLKQAEEWGIPVVTFDKDVVNATRLAYVGTNQEFLGRTTARLLKQLRPEGGTFAVVSPTLGRNEGFLKEITKNNLDPTKPHWWSVENFVIHGEGELSVIETLSAINDNITGIVVFKQAPMRHENWTTIVTEMRRKHPNLVIIGTDGSDFQLDYLNSRFVDGLVGQLPYEMGTTAAQTLYDFLVHGKRPPASGVMFTNVVAYNLIPLALPEHQADQNLLGNLRYLGLTCFGLVAFLCSLCIGWTVLERSSRVVKAAQPVFLILIALGALLLSSSLIPLSFDLQQDDIGDQSLVDLTAQGLEFDDLLHRFHFENMTDPNEPTPRKVAMCMSMPWLASTGFAVVFSALFSKTWRVNQLFKSGGSAYARVTVTLQEVLKPFGVLMACNLVVLTLWTMLDPLTYTRQENDGTDYWNRAISSYGACRSEKSAATYLVPLALVNFCCVAMAFGQAIAARSITSEFAESTYISLCVAFMLQVFLTGIPVIVIVKDQPKPYYVVLTSMIFLLSTVILLLIFLPKVMLTRKYSMQTELEQQRSLNAAIHRSTKGVGLSSKLESSNLQQVGTAVPAPQPTA